jgi:CRP-like cAMP-binding protein
VTLLTNGIIFQLSKEDQNRVQDICKPVQLFAGQILCKPVHHETPKIYFLTGACVALLVKNKAHNALAVGLVGSEGAIGLGSVLDSNSENLHFLVQTSGSAWMAESADFALLLHQRPGMLWVISQHLWQLTEHIAAISVSVQFEDVTTRLARWLALSAERAQMQQLHLTHEHLAQMLGVRRVSITLAAGELKERGLIAYQRGVLSILNLAGLQPAVSSESLKPGRLI